MQKTELQGWLHISRNGGKERHSNFSKQHRVSPQTFTTTSSSLSLRGEMQTIKLINWPSKVEKTNEPRPKLKDNFNRNVNPTLR